MEISEFDIMRALDGNYWITEDDVIVRRLKSGIYSISVNGMIRFAENQGDVVKILFKFCN